MKRFLLFAVLCSSFAQAQWIQQIEPVVLPEPLVPRAEATEALSANLSAVSIALPEASVHQMQAETDLRIWTTS